MDDPLETNDEIKEIIKNYGLQEDEECVIITLKTNSGGERRIHLLKRRYMRIVRADGTFEDYPLREIVEAILKYPNMKLSEALLIKKSD